MAKGEYACSVSDSCCKEDKVNVRVVRVGEGRGRRGVGVFWILLTRAQNIFTDTLKNHGGLLHKICRKFERPCIYV